MRVQALHSIGRPSSDTAGTFQRSEAVAAVDVVALGGGERLSELVVRTKSLGQIAHHTGRLEPPYCAARAHARQPIERRERLAVHEREGFDDGRQSTRTSISDADVTTDGTFDLALDRRAIVGVERREN